MWVWNYNSQFELMLGFGAKDVTIEYSTDGVAWTVLADLQFAQATAMANYAHNTTVDLGGAIAQYVRLTANSGYGMGGQVGLSEVRFHYLPVAAREPQPADGETDVHPDAVLTWRAGRGAVSHDVALATDPEALAGAETVVDNSYDPGGLNFGATYYWRVDEVNDAAIPPAWPGDIWSFATREYLVIDDMESYDDEDNRIYDTWLDGWVNGTGSTVGNLNAPFAETTIVNGGDQSMPLEYVNDTAPFYSEAELDTGGADWAAGDADTLRLYVYGSAGNGAGTLYVAIADTAGNVAVATHADETVLTTEAWQEWAIPYSDLSGVDLSRVATLYIGVGNRNNPTAGGTGTIYIDDVEFGNPAATE